MGIGHATAAQPLQQAGSRRVRGHVIQIHPVRDQILPGFITLGGLETTRLQQRIGRRGEHQIAEWPDRHTVRGGGPMARNASASRGGRLRAVDGQCGPRDRFTDQLQFWQMTDVVRRGCNHWSIDQQRPGRKGEVCKDQTGNQCTQTFARGDGCQYYLTGRPQRSATPRNTRSGTLT